MNTKQITLRVDEKTKFYLDAVSDEMGITINALCNIAIRSYIGDFFDNNNSKADIIINSYKESIKK